MLGAGRETVKYFAVGSTVSVRVPINYRYYRLLDEVEQNIVICQLRAEQINNLPKEKAEANN